MDEMLDFMDLQITISPSYVPVWRIKMGDEHQSFVLCWTAICLRAAARGLKGWFRGWSCQRDQTVMKRKGPTDTVSALG
jgi:hypothetical protein